MIRYLFLILLFLPSKAQSQEADTPYLILISFDGFRHDYVEKYNAPNFKNFISKGSAAKGLIPSFPSKTFPNHYTLVTGMYPGNHGLVGNTFYDPPTQQSYRVSDRSKVENPYFYGGTPLWQLCQEQGLKSASYFWVGSEAPIKGRFPDYYYRYDGSVANDERVEQCLTWLELPIDERPNFISLYFSLVDTQGHDFGPNAPETKAAVLEADRLLGKLMKGLEALPQKVNVILTSDHGMYELKDDPEKVIFMEDILPSLEEEDLVINKTYFCHLYLKNSQTVKKLYQSIPKDPQKYKVYTKKNMPQEWHYHTSKRVGDIFILAKPGFTLRSKTWYQRAKSAGKIKALSGVHGYAPSECPEMQGVFYAQGPQIVTGLNIPAFENIHIYPLISKILGLKTPPNIDGKFKMLKMLYKTPSK